MYGMIYKAQKFVIESNIRKQYAKKLVVYLNWLDQEGLSYEETTNN